MTERERLIELLNTVIFPRESADPAEVVADFLLDNGVRLPVTCGECEYEEKRNGGVWCKAWENYNGYGTYGFCCYGNRRADNGT